MSCQQAPRLTEDPYVFTEAVSAAPVLFNPQKSRHPHNSKPVCQPLQQLTRDSTNANVAQQFFSSRFNGTTTAIETPSASITQQQQIINGMQKNVISITTISNGNSHPGVPINKKLQPQQHHHSHPKIVTTAAVTVTPTSSVSSCSLPTQVISWNQTPTATSSSPPAQQQLQIQHHHQQQQQQQQSFFTLTTNCVGGNVQSLPSPSTLLPPSNFHQNTLAQQLQKVGSTLTNTNSTIPAHWQRQQQQQQQYSKVSVYPQNTPPSVPQNRVVENIVTCHATSSSTPPSNSTTSPSFPSDLSSVQTNHSEINEIPVSVIYRTTPNKSEPGTSPTIVQEAPPSTPSATSPIRKPLNDFCEKNVVFATPAKRDSRVLSSSAKKTLKGSSTGAPGKAKRSQNQTTHHEALPRIPSIINHHSSPSTSLPPATASLSLSSASLRRRQKTRRNSGEWHAPDTYIFDSVSPLTSHIERRQRSAEKCDITLMSARASCVQKHWLGVYDLKDPYGDDISARASNIGREERIERHKALLRRQAVQLISSHAFLKPTAARRRLVFVSKFLQKLKNQEDVELEKKCCVASCPNRALALTAQCYIHITGNVDQHLFLPCTAKFADNTQCRIPVFDISHELPLCREHGWKRDNYNRIAQEQRPKMKVIQKRTKSNGMCGRPPKRSKKKRKGSTSSLESIGSSSTTTFIPTPTRSSTIALAPPNLASNRIGTTIVLDRNSSVATIGGGYTIKLNETTQPMSQQSNMLPGMNTLSPGMEIMNIMKNQHQQDLLTQDMLSICENSSVYASSEDTGVGGLSESELMVGTQDAEEIPLGDTRLLEEHDLTNVLNNLPVDAFNELFTVVRQDEREEVERALELADKQIKSLQQMTGNDTDFLRDLLDGSDQILDDTDICTEIVSSHSPDTSGIDTNTLFVDGGSNSTAGSCTGPTPTDIRGLVQT